MNEQVLDAWHFRLEGIQLYNYYFLIIWDKQKKEEKEDRIIYILK